MPSIVTDPTKYQKARAASGAVSRNNGDDVASILSKLTLDETYDVAAELLDAPVHELVAKYQHLNAGQQRMNLGNRIRAKVKALNGDEGSTGTNALAQIAEPSLVAAKEREEAAARAKAEKAEAKAAAESEPKPKRQSKAKAAADEAGE